MKLDKNKTSAVFRLHNYTTLLNWSTICFEQLENGNNSEFINSKVNLPDAKPFSIKGQSYWILRIFRIMFRKICLHEVVIELTLDSRVSSEESQCGKRSLCA